MVSKLIGAILSMFRRKPKKFTEEQIQQFKDACCWSEETDRLYREGKL